MYRSGGKICIRQAGAMVGGSGRRWKLDIEFDRELNQWIEFCLSEGGWRDSSESSFYMCLCFIFARIVLNLLLTIPTL